MEVKRREILVSIGIFCISLIIGMMLCHLITYNSREELYRLQSATEILDIKGFNHALETDYGDVVAYGQVSGINPFTIQEINQNCLSYERIKEHYTAHTRIVHSGKTTYTQVYYSWDESGSRESAKVKEIIFLGATLPFDRIEFYTTNSDYIYDTTSDRHYYRYTPDKITGSIWTNISNHEISEDSKFYKSAHQDDIISKKSQRIECAPTVFWTIWIVITLLVIFKFCYAENRWLDD